jgi:hypothetical protein
MEQGAMAQNWQEAFDQLEKARRAGLAARNLTAHAYGNTEARYPPLTCAKTPRGRKRCIVFGYETVAEPIRPLRQMQPKLPEPSQPDEIMIIQIEPAQ